MEIGAASKGSYGTIIASKFRLFFSKGDISSASPAISTMENPKWID
jgi:hypothetical protein